MTESISKIFPQVAIKMSARNVFVNRRERAGEGIDVERQLVVVKGIKRRRMAAAGGDKKRKRGIEEKRGMVCNMNGYYNFHTFVREELNYHSRDIMGTILKVYIYIYTQ